MAVSDNNNITRLRWEYTQFLEFVQERKPQRAMIYAKALGIDRRTLVKWMEQKELRDAMAQAVDEILSQMQEAGADDWRMWNRMLELSGVTVADEVDITSGGEALPTPILGALDVSKNKGTNKDSNSQ